MLLARAAAFKPVIGAGRAMGLAGGAVMMAVALGSGFGGLLVAVRPEAPFWVGAGLALFTAVVAPLVYSARLAAEPSSPKAGATRPSLARADVFGPLSAAFVERCTVGMIIVSFALFATRVHGITDRGVGILYSLLTLPFALLMYPASRLGDRVPRASLLCAGALLYGTSLASLAIAPASWLPASMLCAGVASALMYGSVLCYAATLVDAEDRPRMMAWINMTGAFGMMIGPAVGGVLATWTRVEGDPGAGYRVVFMAAGALSIGWAAVVSPWLLGRFRAETSKHPDVRLQTT
jgi:MFS family permease